MSRDPREVLGVGADASEEAIREAYLRKVKEYPPERDAAAFEEVRDAYDALRDPRRRARLELLGGDPGAPLTALLEGRAPVRPFLGPGPWRALLGVGS